MEGKHASSSNTLVVSDPEMAEVLSDPAHLRFIAPFIGFERTVGEVAHETNSTLSTTYRRVKRYCELGILEVVRERERNGKALKLYRAVAEVFFVPNRLTNGEERSALWEMHWRRDFQRGFRHAYAEQFDGWGQRIYRQDGVFTTSLASGPGADVDVLADTMPALYNRFHDSLYLDFAQAKAFQRELDALFKTYMQQRGQQRYMVRISFVPVTENAEIIP